MDSAVQELARDYFDGLFDVVVGQRDDVRAKPYPDSVNKVIQTLEADKAETLYNTLTENQQNQVIYIDQDSLLKMKN